MIWIDRHRDAKDYLFLFGIVLLLLQPLMHCIQAEMVHVGWECIILALL